MEQREFERLLQIHDTDFDLRRRPAYRLLQDAAGLNPDRMALIAADRSLRYGELNAEANALGRCLAGAGVKEGAIVAVMADRDSFAYVSRQGVLKSGGAFLPVDPDYPEDRIRYILEDSHAAFLVTTGDILDRRKDLSSCFEDNGIKVVDVKKAVNSFSRENLDLELSWDSYAYVIYTSGSTGRPKGVGLTGRNLVNFVENHEKNLEIYTYLSHCSCSLAIAALTFDFSIMEEFVPLSNGRTVVLATRQQIMDPKALAALMIENNVDAMCCTPSYISNIIAMEHMLPAVKRLKVIDFGAEAFPPSLFGRLMEINPQLMIINGYGPTEATISCTAEIVTSGDSITIGVPNGNVHVCVVNEENEPLPLGEKGELVILGEGVGAGYIGRDDLNRKSFIELFGRRAYKSGDLARILQDGRIEYHGRLDNQVKLRGLRVELGEIETIMQGFPGIRSSFVTVAKEGQEYLAAYFTADEQVDTKELRSYLKKYLTAYMVPQVYLQLPAFPLTANGKIDGKALPAPTGPLFEMVCPENDIERKLLEKLTPILQTQIGVTDDLLEAGLSSLGAIRLCGEIQDTFNAAIKTSELAGEITIRELAQRIASCTKVQSYARQESYPLTRTQMGIFFETTLHQDTTIYNIPSLYRLDPELDPDRLAEAVRDAVHAHPCLLMQLKQDESGEVRAVRRDELDFRAELIRGSLPGTDQLVRPFDLLSGEPLVRARIYDSPEGKYFFLDTHHIASDGTSIDILVRDINDLYLGKSVAKENYTGFELAMDEEKARAGTQLEEAKKWYDSIFSGCSGETIPVRDGREGSGHIAIKRITGSTDGDAVRKYCELHNLTLNAFFTSAFAFALKEWTGQEQAVFTTIYNGRNDPRLKDSVCMLVKTLPVLLDCDPAEYVASFVGKCQKYLLGAMAHDLYSFMEIRQAYDIQAEVMFAWQGEFEHGMEIGGKEAELRMLELSRSRSPFGLDLALDGAALVFDLEYDPSLFSAWTMESFVHMMDFICAEMTRRDRLKDILLMPADEEQSLLQIHDTDFPVAERPAYRLLEDRAGAKPDAIALIAADRTMTYKELNEEANALGHALLERGAGPEKIVAVLADRDSYAYVMRQGVLKSGAAFLPIDPEYPQDRVRFILKDSGTRLAVTTKKVLDMHSELAGWIEAEGAAVVLADQEIPAHAKENPGLDVPWESASYVIYTSGSTGKPKGVVLTGKNLVCFVDDNVKNREIQGYTRRGKVSLAIAALTFDFSIMEEFVPISAGMTVVLATREQIMNPLELGRLMTDHQVDVMSCTPSYMSNMITVDAMLPAIRNLRSVDFGAEAFPPALFAKLKAINPDLYIMNGYGPTEATISCTMDLLENGGDISIGIPNSNVHVVTADRTGRMQPPGAVGEMIILGDGVGRGYIGRPDLTKKSFIRLLGKRAYKSGDLVRLREDGKIEFHGRIDNQVKLRGLRVELGEIESVLNSYPSVRSSIVIVVRKESEYLAAYFTADEKVDLEKLKKHMASFLTSYMVPQVFMQLEEMPLTANGKINKKALPEPEPASAADIVHPENELQERILAIATDVIGQGNPGIDLDLFEAGLSSIGSISLCARLTKEFGKTVKVSDLADCRTVRQIEGFLKTAREEGSRELRAAYPLSMTQTGIFLDSMLYEGSTVYNIPYLYRLSGQVDLFRLRDALEKAVLAHPVLSMTLKTGEDGKVMAIRNAPGHVDIPLLDTMPDQDDLVRPFHLLSGEPLYRIELYHTPEGKFLFMDTHHIVSDGESIRILLEDVNAAYAGEEPEEEAFTGFEFALEEEEDRASGKYEAAMAWYERMCRGYDTKARPNRNRKDTDIHIATRRLYGETNADAVRAFCKIHNLSLNAFFTAAFGLVIRTGRFSEEAVFATIYNGRSDPRIARSVGMFVKTLPVVLREQGTETVEDCVRESQDWLLNAMAYDIVSFAEIKKAFGIDADVLFAFQGEREEKLEIGGLPADTIELDLSQAKSSAGLDVFLDGSRIVFESEYDPGLYNDRVIEALLHMMDVICGEMTRGSMLRDLKLIDSREAQNILAFHDTDIPVKERAAYRLLEDSAAAVPDAIALIAADRTLTYKELNEDANALGRALAENGAGPEKIVAVLADRDSWAYVMRQGVLKSGAAFLPVDPDYPQERISYILKDSGTKLVVTTEQVLERHPDLRVVFADAGVHVVEAAEAVRTHARGNLGLTVPWESAAYVIYTSGSTGRPKGVVLTGKNLVSFVDDNEKNREVQGYTRRGHVSLAIAALTFDFSIMEEFVPIANRMTVVLATQEQIMNPLELAGLMMDTHVDVMSCTPSYMSNMITVDAMFPAVRNLRSVDFGAEAFPPALFKKLRDINPDLHIMNGYGPTEATISCTMDVVESGDNITIGIPNANVHVATLDRFGRVQPRGSIGEMVIIGDGVGRGYIGRDDLTKKSFITLFERRAYRSGDLVRVRADGKIEFRGRIDNQVKLRGLRVELGEIESVLNSYPSVRSSIVLVMKKESEYLAAYFTADEPVDVEKLKEHLAGRLTEYMVPQVFLQLDEMPLTANGKIDKKALPEINPEIRERHIVEPQNDTELIICDIFRKTLGLDEFGANEDFFELGGTSLTASQALMAMILKELPVVFQDIFNTRTPQRLARQILEKGAKEAQAHEKAKESGQEEHRQELFEEQGCLSHNSIPYVDEIAKGELGDLLLTGATGFLGAHVLRELVRSTDGKVWCVVRGGSRSAKERLKSVLFFYFESDLINEIDRRVQVIEGDLSDAAMIDTLEKLDFRTVINCAACVKHFADYKFMENANLHSVEHLTELCLKKGARLVQISTVSVAGDNTGNCPEYAVLKENTLDLGQEVKDNAYVYTKYLAEKHVLNAIEKRGLDAKIMRVSNLMSREKDAEFQMNFRTNAFMNTLRAYFTLGSVPLDQLDEQVELSYIDETARAIVLLAGTDRSFTVFHPYNTHSVEMGDIILCMNHLGIHVDAVTDDVFKDRLNRAMARENINQYISPLVDYDLEDDGIRQEIPADNRFTTKALYRLGFHWTLTDMAFVERMLHLLDAYGYFDLA